MVKTRSKAQVQLGTLPVRMQDNGPRGVVIKSNALINAVVDLSLQGQRFLAFVVSTLDDTHDTSAPLPDRPIDLELDVLRFADLFRIPTCNVHREVERLADILQRKIITLPPDQTLTGHRVKVGLIVKQAYEHGQGRILLRLDEDILPHLLGLRSHFTQYRIKDVYQFTRASAWRLYELLRQYKGLGKREIALDELKGALGLGATEYPRFVDLQKRVINPAMIEINRLSDIEVEADPIRYRRTVKGMLFLIRPNTYTMTMREQINAAMMPQVPKHDMTLARALHNDNRVMRRYAAQLSSLATMHGIVDKILALLPAIKARYEALRPEDKMRTLGAYTFTAVMAEIDRLTSNRLPI